MAFFPSRPGGPLTGLAFCWCFMAHPTTPLSLASSLRVDPVVGCLLFHKTFSWAQACANCLLRRVYERRSSSSVDRTLRREQSFIPAHAVKSEGWCRRCVKRTRRNGLLLPANMAFLLDDLGHGQPMRKMEDEFVSVRSF